MLMTLWSLLGPAMVLSFLLIGIHCYLGLHVLARGVIFIDLALAQVAALGGIFFLILFGESVPHWWSYVGSVLATWIVAAFLALMNRFGKEKISQEALIGIIFALASSCAILLLGQAPHGAEHLQKSLVGQLLWTSWQDVLKVFLIYGVVSIILFKFRSQFQKASFSGGTAWFVDFCFYALFGIVITSSVSVSGVLLVFSFLIVPALISGLFYDGLAARLLFGWIFGFILSVVGLILSYFMDAPSGAFLVAIFNFSALLVAFATGVLRFRRLRIHE